MSDLIFESSPPEYPNAQLERAFFEEFLAAKGYHLNELDFLPEETARAIRIEASIYASNKLAEIETRSKLVHDLIDKS